jgi:hypothetical protein
VPQRKKSFLVTLSATFQGIAHPKKSVRLNPAKVGANRNNVYETSVSFRRKVFWPNEPCTPTEKAKIASVCSAAERQPHDSDRRTDADQVSNKVPDFFLAESAETIASSSSFYQHGVALFLPTQWHKVRVSGKTDEVFVA